MNESHRGRCYGGPYNGQYRNYYQNRMPVYTMPDPSGSGEYVFVPTLENEQEGSWFWRGLTTK